jgi:hypothetical protein
VKTSRSLKIEHNQEYPCPCRKQGNLQPIYLTEAFGCNRCQEIFALEENGHIIEQLGSMYPYKKAWRWTGYYWKVAHRGVSNKLLPLLIASVLVLIFLMLRILFGPVSIGFLVPWLLSIAFWGFLISLILWVVYHQ